MPSASFDESMHASDLVSLDVEAGTIVAFHQALWHSARPNLSRHHRLNCYFAFSPTWMRPIDHHFPDQPWIDSFSPPLTAMERVVLGAPRPPTQFFKCAPAQIAPFQVLRRQDDPGGAVVAYVGGNFERDNQSRKERMKMSLPPAKL